ncbi:hypothetical protein V8F44DRAFT_664448 [Aspergillus fumigatus]
MEVDSESSTGTENYNELAASDSLAEENNKFTKDCTQESDHETTDKRFGALMYLSVEQFLKLDIIQEIIASLMKATLNKRVQFEVLCMSQKQHIDLLNHYLAMRMNPKLNLHSLLSRFCADNPERREEWSSNNCGRAGDEAIQCHEWQDEVIPKYWIPR